MPLRKALSRVARENICQIVAYQSNMQFNILTWNVRSGRDVITPEGHEETTIPMHVILFTSEYLLTENIVA